MSFLRDRLAEIDGAFGQRKSDMADALAYGAFAGTFGASACKPKPRKPRELVEGVDFTVRNG